MHRALSIITSYIILYQELGIGRRRDWRGECEWTDWPSRPAGQTDADYNLDKAPLNQLKVGRRRRRRRRREQKVNSARGED